MEGDLIAGSHNEQTVIDPGDELTNVAIAGVHSACRVPTRERDQAFVIEPLRLFPLRMYNRSREPTEMQVGSFRVDVCHLYLGGAGLIGQKDFVPIDT